jgi:hypothetical protein
MSRALGAWPPRFFALVLATCVFVPKPAHGESQTPTQQSPKQAPLVLSVVRGEAAADCPDADTLSSSVNARLGSAFVVAGSAMHPGEGFRVTIDKTGNQYTAVVEGVGSHAGRRVLSDDGPSCEGLASALAVTLAIALSPIRTPPPPSPTAPPAGPRKEEKKPVEVSAPTPAHSGTARIEVAGGATVAVPRPGAAATVLGQVHWVRDRWSAGAGGFWVPPQTVDWVPGRVHVSLSAGFVTACFSPWQGHAVDVRFCLQPTIGALQGRGEGYSPDREATRPWLAMGAGALAGGALMGPLRWQAHLVGMWVAREERFTIDDRGTAYSTPRVGALVALGVSYSIF